MKTGINGIPGAAVVVPFTSRRPGAPCGPRSPSFLHWQDFKEWVVGMVDRLTGDLTTKADKVPGGTAGNLAGIGADGNLVDSGLRSFTFDTVPTAGSLNPVTSGGVRQAIDAATPGDYDSVKARLVTVEGKIPLQASAQNQLADKAFVNSSVATNTANYISDNGEPFTSLADLENYQGALTNNDYAFVVGVDEDGNTVYTRYKYNDVTETWAEEYKLNNSSFTAEQWAAISSGITSGLVAKLGALPTAQELASALVGKQDVLTFDNTPTKDSQNPVKSGGIWSMLWGTLTAIPLGLVSVYEWANFELTSVTAWVQSHFLPLTGGTITGSLAVQEDLRIAGMYLAPVSQPTQSGNNQFLSLAWTEAGNKQAILIPLSRTLGDKVALLSDIPVQSVNNKTGAVVLTASDVGAATTAFAQSAARYDLGEPIITDSSSVQTDTTDPDNPITYAEVTLADRTANFILIYSDFDELRITFPAVTSGKVRDFGLRVEVGAGAAALAAPALVPIAPTGEIIKIENNAAEIPELADGTATAKGVTLLYFSETAPGVFVVKGEQVEEVA